MIKKHNIVSLKTAKGSCSCNSALSETLERVRNTSCINAEKAEASNAERLRLQEQLTAEQAKTALLQGALEDLGTQLASVNAQKLGLQEQLAQQQAEAERLRAELGALNSQLSNAQASGDQARDAQAEAERERDVLREAFSQP